jgi:hypothetical protein
MNLAIWEVVFNEFVASSIASTNKILSSLSQYYPSISILEGYFFGILLDVMKAIPILLF